MKILIADAFDDSLPGRLAPFGEVTQDAAKAAEADVLLVRSKTKVTKEYLEGAPSLKLIIRGGVGLDNIDVEAATRQGVWVANVPDFCVEEVSEHAVGLLLAWSRGIVAFDRETHAGLWRRAF